MRATLDHPPERLYSALMQAPQPDSGAGVPTDTPAPPYRRAKPDMAEQARRERWGNLWGPLVKQVYNQSKET